MTVELIPGEFSQFTIAIAIISGFIVIFGYVSIFVKEKLFISEAFVALVVGIIAGPLVANGIDPYSWDDMNEITKQITRCVIAIQVMAVGIELPKHYLKKEWATFMVLMFPVMIFMWLISGLFIWALIPPIDYLNSLVIAACVTPTDPVLANSVVKGRFAEKHVPSHIRNALAAESGGNDGMGFPFLFLAIFLLGEPGTGKAIGKWIYETCLFQIALSVVIGIIVGFVARKILQWSERNRLIDKPSFLSFAIALALFLMSMTGFSGSDDVLACFAAGNAFSWDDWFRQETEEAHFQEVIDMLLNLSVFVYIGTIIPWREFGNSALGLSPWRLVVIAILILFFRRMPIVIALKPIMPAMKTYREATFSGWFGPMGVGAVFLSTIAKEEMEKVYEHEPEFPIIVDLIGPVVLFVVLASTLVHGSTIPLFQLGKRIRTRTLSIASSTGSNRLKWRRSTHDLDETQRNTLINMLGKRRRRSKVEEEQEQEQQQQPPEHAAVDMEDAEEDYLPHDEEDEEVEQQEAAAHVGGEPSNQQLKPSLEGHSATSESQSGSNIRFLEPTHPRQHPYSESNESYSSDMQDQYPTGKHPATSANDEESYPHSEEEAEKAGDDPNVSSEQAERVVERYHCDIHPRIEVWEERPYVIIEDTGDTTPNIVINKREGNWKRRMRDAIKKLEADIEREEHHKQQ